MSHVHVWTAVRALGRYACACGVQGHKPSIIPGQHRTAAHGVKPYACRFVLGSRKTKREMCGADAVHVTGDRSMSRCADHCAPRGTEATHV